MAPLLMVAARAPKVWCAKMQKQAGQADGRAAGRENQVHALHGGGARLLHLLEQIGGRQLGAPSRRAAAALGERQLAEPMAEQRGAPLEELLLVWVLRALRHRLEQLPRQQQQQRRRRRLAREDLE